MSVPELKPCPFCGKEASRLDGHYDFGGEWFETGCDNVGCRVLPSAKTLSRHHADESWNTRADTIPSPEALICAALDAAAGPIYKLSLAAAEEIEALADDPEAIARIIKTAEGRG